MLFICFYLVTYMGKFVTDIFPEEEANVIVFGVPIGKYAQESLQSLREASWFVETFDVDKKKNLLENVRIADSGDLSLNSFEEITDKTSEIISKRKIPLILSASHLISFYSLQAVKDAKIVIFDAHCDLKNEYEDGKIREISYHQKISFDSKINDATWLRRLLEKINSENIFLLGMRSLSEEELKFLEEKKITFVTANDLKEHMNEARTALWKFTENSKVYISLDIDVFDPSIAPAVDHPEPNGILFNEFQQLCQEINGEIVGLDVCCLKPIKENQVTEFLTVKVIFKILSLIKGDD